MARTAYRCAARAARIRCGIRWLPLAAALARLVHDGLVRLAVGSDAVDRNEARGVTAAAHQATARRDGVGAGAAPPQRHVHQPHRTHASSAPALDAVGTNVSSRVIRSTGCRV